ncbi:MAG: OsmC family protein [Bacteroidetes bacterium]|nr:OsmC family protein [Bacteroidota bacterium]
MKVSANILSGFDLHKTTVQTDGSLKQISIAPKSSGLGSSVNGAELLLLSIATCFCNDIYREAQKRNLKVSGVEVTVTADFGAEGEPGTNFQYSVNVISTDSPEDIQDLIHHVDKIAEIHGTLRKGVSITLTNRK